MKGFAMLEIGKTGWIEKERPKCGPMGRHRSPVGSFTLHIRHSHGLGRSYRSTS